MLASLLNRFVVPGATGLVLLLVTLSARAQYEVAEIPIFDAPKGTAALGGGLRLGRDLYLESDNDEIRRFDLVPLYLYNGKFVFFRGTSGGIHLVSNGRLELNLLGRYRFNQLDPGRSEYYDGMDKRKQTVDAGIELTFRGKWGGITANYLADTLNRHQGQSAEFTYRYPIDRGSLSLTPFISWTWQSDRLANYYYGVRDDEARPDRPAYSPGRAQFMSFGLNTTWWLSDRAQFFANLGFTGSDKVVTDSPLTDLESATTFFAGGTYVFGNVRKPELYISSGRAREWSWKVNYGYQAHGNIVGKSDFADTTIGGLTFAKLLTDGPRVDFTGKLAFFRHFEKDEGNGNFWSTALYIAATGKGFSPWSHEEVFRYSFGFGMSYAEKVPITEQRKQAAKGNNTARFLNYLELQLDYPLKRLFKSPSMQDCYAGLTIVHRSGIFGTSDILGDVAGGSDWITAHMECTLGRTS